MKTNWLRPDFEMERMMPDLNPDHDRMVRDVRTMTRKQRYSMLTDAIMNMVERNDAEEIVRFVIHQFDGDAEQIVADYANSKDR